VILQGALDVLRDQRLEVVAAVIIEANSEGRDGRDQQPRGRGASDDWHTHGDRFAARVGSSSDAVLGAHFNALERKLRGFEIRPRIPGEVAIRALEVIA
jgi:hypothetical protein